VSSIIVDNQKIVYALTRLHAPANTYMKSYYDKVQAGQGDGSWGDFAQELKYLQTKRWQGESKEETNSTLGQQRPS